MENEYPALSYQVTVIQTVAYNCYYKSISVNSCEVNTEFLISCRKFLFHCRVGKKQHDFINSIPLKIALNVFFQTSNYFIVL